MSAGPRVIVASAPGRCGIVGNPSDIYGGTVVSCAIEKRNICRLTFGQGRRLPDDLRLWNAATARFPLDEPVYVDWFSAVPRSSGLAGSTALLAATLLAVLEARGEAPDLSQADAKIQFSELVRDVERHEAGITCGFQDAYMVVHGGLNRMDFVGKSPELEARAEKGPTGLVTPLKSVLHRSELPFLLITTGVERLSGSVHGPMVDRWLGGEALVRDGISRIAALGALGAEAIINQDWDTLGALMNENQRITASLGGSGEAIDQLVADCLASGAKGAKLAGAGLGGTVIALTEDAFELEARLRKCGYETFTRPELSEGVKLEEPGTIGLSEV